MSSSVLLQTLALQKNAPRKDGQEARAFRVEARAGMGSQSLVGIRTHSLDAHVGRPGLRSLPVRFAFALRAALASRARL